VEYIQLASYAATECPSGTKVDWEDCESAGLSLGNTLRNGANVIEGSWNHSQCGCFTDAGDKGIHYDYGSTCSIEYPNQLICKKAPVEDVQPSVEYVQLTRKTAMECPAVTKVDPHRLRISWPISWQSIEEWNDS
jgi:hypothetical protein